MAITFEPLAECIGRAVRNATFRTFYGNRFDSSAMREIYARKLRRDSLSSTDAIDVCQTELAGLVSTLAPMMDRHRSPGTGAVGNGLYNFTGSLASPRLPSIEDYAKILSRSCAIGCKTSRGLARRME